MPKKNYVLNTQETIANWALSKFVKKSNDSAKLTAVCLPYLSKPTSLNCERCTCGYF